MYFNNPIAFLYVLQQYSCKRCRKTCTKIQAWVCLTSQCFRRPPLFLTMPCHCICLSDGRWCCLSSCRTSWLH